MRPVVPEAQAEQGVAPAIVMLVVPRVDPRRYVTKRDLVKYARNWREACTMRRFLTMTDAETALASSWQVMTIRDKLSE